MTLSKLPKLTFWRVVLVVILAVGAYSTYARFFHGLGGSTNLTDRFPWGLWIGFDVLCGVGTAAGGFTLAAVVYVDHYGNLMTGLRAAMLAPDAVLTVAGRRLSRARTFSDVPAGTAFWYENANGLAEIAVNCGRAEGVLGGGIGAAVDIGSD